jgi:hypothetical protein
MRRGTLQKHRSDIIHACDEENFLAICAEMGGQPHAGLLVDGRDVRVHGGHGYACTIGNTADGACDGGGSDQRWTIR